MSPCGRARRQTSRGAMAVLAWKFPRTRLPMGASALCVVVLCWLYIFPVYRLPNEKEIVQGVLQQGTAWRRNQTAARAFRYSCPRAISRDGTSLLPVGLGNRIEVNTAKLLF
uniref:ST8 alpha-N-acetyl-neuraminide alpha-2,8-sialyltransferase 1 n=1 Tax=Aotus nancymaae TaxID=37293 RepID=A0A2K5DDK3_AOTNA